MKNKTHKHRTKTEWTRLLLSLPLGKEDIWSTSRFNGTCHPLSLAMFHPVWPHGSRSKSGSLRTKSLSLSLAQQSYRWTLKNFGVKHTLWKNVFKPALKGDTLFTGVEALGLAAKNEQRLNHFQFEVLPALIPNYLMPTSLMKWVRGRKTSGTLLHYGRTCDFPWKEMGNKNTQDVVHGILRCLQRKPWPN